MLSASDKQFLLKVARDTVESVVNNSPLPQSEPCPPALKQPCGAFVTLRQESELRGCIGYTEDAKPLVETVQEVAAKAATDDPRFMAVSPAELPSIEIEISVISSMKPVKNIDEIEIGKHGLLLEWRDLRGLLLPQVPVEYGWNKEMFLNQVSRKAGLPAIAWRDPETNLFTFTAEVFNEHSSELA